MGEKKKYLLNLLLESLSVFQSFKSRKLSCFFSDLHKYWVLKHCSNSVSVKTYLVVEEDKLPLTENG